MTSFLHEVRNDRPCRVNCYRSSVRLLLRLYNRSCSLEREGRVFAASCIPSKPFDTFTKKRRNTVTPTNYDHNTIAYRKNGETVHATVKYGDNTITHIPYNDRSYGTKR